MNSSSSQPRLFYSLASASLLVLTLIGFRFFYLHGQAFPGRELTPPIRTLLITHGILMTSWMLLAIVQPLLVASGKKRLHMTLGRIAAVLALLILVVGWKVGIAAASVNPPELRLFGLNPKQFLTVPTLGVTIMAVFIAVGVWQRRRPEIHRPMMFMASLSSVSAAIGRIPLLNFWWEGTVFEYLFTASFATMLVGAVIFAIKCAITRSFDRWFGITFGVFCLWSLAMGLIARTALWDSFATYLTQP